MLLEELRPRKIDVAHKIVHIFGHIIDVGNEILEDTYGPLHKPGSIREMNTFVYDDLILSYNINFGWPSPQSDTTYDDEVVKANLVEKLLNSVILREAKAELAKIGWEVVQHQIFAPEPGGMNPDKTATRFWMSRVTLQLWIKESEPTMDKKSYDRLHDAIRKMAEYEFPDVM